MRRIMRRFVYFIARLLVYIALFFVSFHLIKELLRNTQPKGIKIIEKPKILTEQFLKVDHVVENSSAGKKSKVDLKLKIEFEEPRDKLPFKVKSSYLPFCEGLFNGEKQSLTMALKYVRANPKIVLDDKDYVDLTANCDQFKRSREYVLKPLSGEEKNFSIAYSIIAYKGAEQVERMLRSIYMPQNYYCLHYDAKSLPSFRKAMKSIAKCFDNVFIASKITPVHWGTMEVLEAEMNCLRDLVKYKWRYFINLTGQEMPLRSNRELVRILKTYDGANDIEGTVKSRNKERFEFVHVKNHITKTRKPPPPWNMTITKGSIHIVASREFIDFAVNNQKAKDLYEWLKDTGVPDESFFSTLNHNPHLGAPGAYKGIPETHALTKPFLARFKNWRSGHFHAGPCHGKWVRDVCVLGVGDLAKIPKRRELFVNKFDIHHQYLALDCMEERIRNKTIESSRKDFSVDTSYYEKLSFVRNKL